MFKQRPNLPIFSQGRAESAAEGKTVIEVEGLEIRRDGQKVLRGVTFRVEPGEIVGFLGPNGAGKSTTLRVIAGVLRPHAGSVRVAGGDPAASPQVRRRIGWQPEQTPVVGNPSVAEYLALAARTRGVKGSVRAAVRAELGAVGLPGFESRAVSRLSKGERMRVGLAFARLGDPDVLLLDEPTSGLDPEQLGVVRELIRADQGRRAVLVSTHLLAEASALCDRVVILHEGEVVADGGARELRVGERELRLRLRRPQDDEAVRRLVTETAGVRGVAAWEPHGDHVELTVATEDAEEVSPRLVAALVRAEQEVVEVSAAESLERAFARIVSGRRS